MITRAERDSDIGRPDEADQHPLICCAPHILHGHAHLKDRQVVIERVLLALMKERKSAPLALEPTKHGAAVTVSDAEVKAVYRYSVEVFQKISHLYAELDRMKKLYEGMSKGTPKPRL